MSKKSESNLNEMMAGDGSGLQLPPAFVMVNPRQHRKYKKNNQEKRTIKIKLMGAHPALVPSSIVYKKEK